MKKLIDVNDLRALAKFVDDAYDNDYESFGEFNATCNKCHRNTIATEHKKNCVYGIAARTLKILGPEKKA